MTDCKKCHWYSQENDKIQYNTLGEAYICPCINIGESGWEMWMDCGVAPKECKEFVEVGGYKPTGIWADISKIVGKIGDVIENDAENKN